MPLTRSRRAVGRAKSVRRGKEAGAAFKALKWRLRVTKADRLIRMMENHGLGPFVPEFAFATAIGRAWRFDVAWPRLRVAVEIEGGIFGKGGAAGAPCVLCKQVPKGAHGAASGILRDIEKYNAGMMLGWRIYRVPTNAVTWETVRAIAALLDIARRDYRPPGRMGSRPRVSTSRQPGG